jgi:uncharacterized protein YjbI with pentapeptide repeats
VSEEPVADHDIAEHGIDWDSCADDGCAGVRLPAGGRCWVHAGEPARDQALKRLGQDGILDARGVQITRDLLRDLLDAAPKDQHRRPILESAAFDGAAFRDDVFFHQVTFRGNARFRGAVFGGDSAFVGVTFQGAADFSGVSADGDCVINVATFKGPARFRGASFRNRARIVGADFHDRADFSGAIIDRNASFSSTTFHSSAIFDGLTVGERADFGAVDEGEAAEHPAVPDRPRSREATSFRDTAYFSEATFGGESQFRRTSFGSGAVFTGAIFRDRADFTEANFDGALWGDTGLSADFAGSAFHRTARFSRVFFRHTAAFSGVTFHGRADFHSSAFGDGSFRRAAFAGTADFSDTTFAHAADFGGATFRGDTEFESVTTGGDALFSGASFEQTRAIGPLLIRHELVLDDTRFTQPVRIEASTPALACRQAKFSGGVQFRLRWAAVILDDTEFAGPSTLTGIPRLTGDTLADTEHKTASAWQAERVTQNSPRPVSGQPRLLSLQRANVARLGLSRVDLADCRFAGAHNLDELRLEADVTLATAPARLGQDRRRVIAEERAWRARRSRHWTAPEWPEWAGETPAVLEAGQIAGLYRALRKGREDSRDEPGAADYYYGEMEMRRHARIHTAGSEASGFTGGVARGRTERGILTVYWAVSGYGLRALRALAWLTGLIAGFAVAFHLTGFTVPPHPSTYWTSLLYAFRATLSLTDDEVKLTAWGNLLQALLRLTGPVLLGLALLALRGRVKR